MRDDIDMLSVKSCNERGELAIDALESAVGLTSYQAGCMKFLKPSIQLIIHCCDYENVC